LAEVSQEVKGTYVAVKYNPWCILKLISLAKEFEVPNILDEADYHTTLIYSTIYADNVEVLENIRYIGIPKEFEIWKSQSGKNCLVLKINSLPMVQRHDELMQRYGFNYGFPEYQPHITLSYDVGDWAGLEEINKVISLNKFYYMVVTTHEYTEDLQLDWADK
jgi:2'-5' RNA ligase